MGYPFLIVMIRYVWNSKFLRICHGLVSKAYFNTRKLKTLIHLIVLFDYISNPVNEWTDTKALRDKIILEFKTKRTDSSVKQCFKGIHHGEALISNST